MNFGGKNILGTGKKQVPKKGPKTRVYLAHSRNTRGTSYLGWTEQLLLGKVVEDKVNTY